MIKQGYFAVSIAAALTLNFPGSFAFSATTYIRPTPLPPGLLDTRTPPSETDAFIYRLVFSTVVRYGRNGEIKPGLAKSWKILEKGKIIELSLRPGVLFHDGSALQASDVKYSLERLINSKGYTGASLSQISLVKADDRKNSVRLLLKSGNPRFLYILADSTCAILKKGQNSDSLNGTGPFVLEAKLPTGYSFRKNAQYFDKVGEIDQISLQTLDKESAKSAYINGKVDDLFHYHLNPAERRALKDRCNWHYELLPTFRFLVLKANSHPALSTPASRLCILSVLNREEISSRIAFEQPLLEGYLPKGIFGGNLLPSYNRPQRCSPDRLAKIRVTTKKMPLQILGVDSSREVVKVIERSFAEAGIRTQIVLSPNTDTFFKRMHDAQVSVYAARFTARTPDVEAFLGPFTDRVPFFPLGLKNQLIEKEVGLVGTLSNPQERAAVVAKVFRLIGEENVLLPLHQFEFSGCVAPQWSGVEIPLTGFIDQEMNLVSKKKL